MTWTPIRSTITALIAGLALSACGGPAETGPEPDAAPPAPVYTANVSVADAFLVKPAAGRDVTGGGFVVTGADLDAEIISVSTPAAERVEMHTMAMEDGMMKMSQVPSIDVPAGGTVKLERGGLHLMLFGLESLEVGTDYPLEIEVRLADGTTKTLTTRAEVRGLGD